MKSTRTRSRLTILFAAVIVSVALTGCEWFVEEVLFGAGGYVVDARGAATDMSGFDVTLTSVNGKESDSDATSSSGRFSFSNLESGTYIVTAEKTGWFIPPTKVTVGGLAESIPDIPAYQLSEDDLWGLSFIAVWDNTEGGSEEDDVDVDIHMTFSTTWTSQGGAATFSTPYDAYPSDGREQVHFNAALYPSASDDPAVRLDNDTTPFDGAYGDANPQLPETITMLYAPTDIGEEDTTGSSMSMASTTAADSNGLRAAFFDDLAKIDSADQPSAWYWFGQAEVYLNAFNYDGTATATLANDDSSGASARLYVIQTVPGESDYSSGYKGDPITELDYVYLGSYAVPEYTNISSAAMVRVNMLLDDNNYEWYQIVPDIRVIPQGPTVDDGGFDDITFLSVDDQSSVSGVRGRKRGGAE